MVNSPFSAVDSTGGERASGSNGRFIDPVARGGSLVAGAGGGWRILWRKAVRPPVDAALKKRKRRRRSERRFRRETEAVEVRLSKDENAPATPEPQPAHLGAEVMSQRIREMSGATIARCGAGHSPVDEYGTDHGNLGVPIKHVILLMTVHWRRRAAEVFKHTLSFHLEKYRHKNAAMASIKVNLQQTTDGRTIGSLSRSGAVRRALNINASEYLRSVLVKRKRWAKNAPPACWKIFWKRATAAVSKALSFYGTWRRRRPDSRRTPADYRRILVRSKTQSGRRYSGAV